MVSDAMAMIVLFLFPNGELTSQGQSSPDRCVNKKLACDSLSAHQLML
jgi:hypothetical protein